MNSSKLITFFFIFFVAVSCTPRSLSVAQKNACMAPSANFKALDAIHSTKIHAILWAKKFAKQASSKELSLSDKCRQTQILIKALYGLRDGESANWENPQNNTSGKIKILKTKVGDKLSEGDLILILDQSAFFIIKGTLECSS